MIKKQFTGNGEPPPKKQAPKEEPMESEADGDTGNGEPPPK